MAFLRWLFGFEIYLSFRKRRCLIFLYIFLFRRYWWLFSKGDNFSRILLVRWICVFWVCFVLSFLFIFVFIKSLFEIFLKFFDSLFDVINTLLIFLIWVLLKRMKFLFLIWFMLERIIFRLGRVWRWVLMILLIEISFGLVMIIIRVSVMLWFRVWRWVVIMEVGLFRVLVIGWLLGVLVWWLWMGLVLLLRIGLIILVFNLLMILVLIFPLIFLAYFCPHTALLFYNLIFIT